VPMIELAFFSGMTNSEIAKEVGQSPAVVEAGLRYAMLQLFRLFKSMGFSVEPGTLAHRQTSPLWVCVLTHRPLFPLTAIYR